MIGRLSDTLLMDLWARWTEHRPPGLEWTTTLELRQDRTPLRELMGAQHTAVVRLHEHRAGRLLTLAEWDVPVDCVPEVFEGMIAAFGDERLMMTCAHRMVPWYGQLVQDFVWGYALQLRAGADPSGPVA